MPKSITGSKKRARKACTGCGAERGPSDHGRLCAACRRESRRAIYHSDPTTRAYQLAYTCANLIKRRFPTVEVVVNAHDYVDALLKATACTYCGQPNDGTHPFNLDHKVALSLGGRHALDNLQPCCEPCNRAKRDMPMADYLAWLRGVVERGAVPVPLRKV